MHDVAEYSTENLALTSWVWIPSPDRQDDHATLAPSPDTTPIQNPLLKPPGTQRDFFKPLRHWLDGLEIHNSQQAHWICRMIPTQCPFERDVKIAGHVLFHIPPMCKLNPVYDEVVALRFRALCYLADECGEDISAYC